MATALGDVASVANTKRAICLMAAQGANTGAPSSTPKASDPASAAAGVPNYPTNIMTKDDGACFTGRDARESTLLIRTTAGTGVITGTFTLWGYLEAAQDWFPIKVNAGNAIGETSADKIQYQERFVTLGHYDRLYLELESIGGSGEIFEAWLVTGLSSCA